MKLHLHTIAKKQFEFDVEMSTTVGEVKGMLADEFEVASIRLCFSGAVLEDAKTIGELGLTETTSVVVMGRKKNIPRPSALPATESAPPEETPAPATVSASAVPAPNPSAVPVPEVPAVSAPAPAPSPGPVSAIPVGAPVLMDPSARVQPVNAHLIDDLIAMGFEDREQVALALRAAYMDPGRAVEYILNGIPPYRIQELTEETETSRPAIPLASLAQERSTAAPNPSGSTLRTSLWEIPQFEQIRSVFQSNTDSLPVVMEQIAQLYPRIFQMIEDHPEEFLAIMQETNGRPSEETTAPAQGESIELPPEHQEAIAALVSLGGGLWDVPSAALVYTASGGNMEVAASLLFEHGGVPPQLLNEVLTYHTGQEGEGEDDGTQESGGD